ncbi:hypothetical protein TNCV_3102821 [Trichonephila clavipes]|nr:hypothetical protein TNCV_3102821 [Trichonephila clavipes]
MSYSALNTAAGKKRTTASSTIPADWLIRKKPWCHAAKEVANILRRRKREVPGQLPYSLDMNPCDYDHSTKIKQLRGIYFNGWEASIWDVWSPFQQSAKLDVLIVRKRLITMSYHEVYPL